MGAMLRVLGDWALAAQAEKKESVAAKKMADKVSLHKQEQEKREQIEGYRVQYESHLDRLGEAGVSGRTLSDYRQFLGNLDDVIQQQSALVEKAAENVDQSRSEWLNKYHRRSALEQLVEMQRKEKIVEAEKKQQKILDEMNSNRRAEL